MTRAAWITGIGLVTPLGIGREATWKAMCGGESGVHAIRGFDTAGAAVRIAGELPSDFDSAFQTRCRLPFPNRYARFTRQAMLAAGEALDDSRLALATENPERLAVSLGVGAGSFHYLKAVEDALARGTTSLEAAVDHNFVVKHMANAAAAQISIWLGLQGPSTTINAACASGAQAIATGLQWIRSGVADVVFAGASDATVDRFVLHAYHRVGALSTRTAAPEEASCPFDRRRDGFVMAEGAAVLVLESEAHARARGAKRYASLLGEASTSEAYNVVNPRPQGEGMARTMRLALADAGIAPAAIGYISAHGTSTPANDRTETLAIRQVFGADSGIPVSSQKSMMGHAIGATSAIEAAVCALTLSEGVITPTINYREPDPDCDLDCVPNEARRAQPDFVMSNAFGFGGHNCCLVFGR